LYGIQLNGVENILGGFNLNNIQNLYAVNTESTTVDKATSLLDYQGELFEKQALEYMKYKVPVNTITNFLDNTSIMEDTKT